MPSQARSIRSAVSYLTLGLALVTIVFMGTEETALLLGHNLLIFHAPAPVLYSKNDPLPMFDESGMEAFLALYEDTSWQRAKRLVAICSTTRHLCGGIADRLRGIPYALSLAIVTGRQFIIHPSILTNEVEHIGGDERNSSDSNEREYSHYHLVDADCDRPDLVHNLFVDSSDTIYVTVNCKASVLDRALLVQDRSISIDQALASIEIDCRIPHRCGAAVIHRMDEFKHDLDRAHTLVANLFMLPFRKYTALHVRAGGSPLTVGNVTVPAVPWDDGHKADVAQAWIDIFRTGSFQHCQKTVAIVSDSPRFISELRFAATSHLILTHCCGQPLHLDRYVGGGFPLQEVVDLYVLARANRVIASKGGFGILGRYWLGGSPESLKLLLTLSAKDVENAESMFANEALCK